MRERGIREGDVEKIGGERGRCGGENREKDKEIGVNERNTTEGEKERDVDEGWRKRRR